MKNSGDLDNAGDWELVEASKFKLFVYPCGVEAGVKLRLKDALVCRDPEGNETYRFDANSEWIVLRGNSNQPDVIWLRNPDGDTHTWDDSDLLDRFKIE